MRAESVTYLSRIKEAPIPPWVWCKGMRDTSMSKRAATRSGQMASVGEVRRYVGQCGSSGLDGDGDGVSCESPYR
jgi:hypothetical protein